MTSLRGLSKKGDLEISLLETKGVSGGDIFCIIDLPPNKPFKTHLFKGPNPKFNEKFTLDLMTLNDEEITITLKEQKPAGSKFIGQIQIQIKALSNQPAPQWYFLTDRPLKDGKKPKVVSGSIQVQLNFIHRYQKKSKPKINDIAQQFATSSTNNSNSAHIHHHNNSNSSHSNQIQQSSSSSPSINRINASNGLANSTSSMSSTASISSSLSSSFSAMSDKDTGDQVEYLQEETVIIDATLRDKESIVLKELKQQKDLISKFSETLRKRERDGASTSADKIKIQQMQEEIAEMERLVSKSTPTTTTTTTTSSHQQSLSNHNSNNGSLNGKTNTILNEIERTASNATMSKRSGLNSTTLSPSPSTNSITTISSDNKFKPQQQQHSEQSHHSVGVNSTSTLQKNESVEVKLKMVTMELENERKLKENIIEKNKWLIKENEKLEKECDKLQTLQSHTKDNSIKLDELALKVKMIESDNHALVQEKAVLIERAKLYEKESQKLEKEVEYERQLKKKEVERKEAEREEVKRLEKELELHQNKSRLLQTELDKKTSTNATNNNNINQNNDQKLKLLQLELDSERKSKELTVERMKSLERDLDKATKLADKWESEVLRLQQQINTLTTLNGKLTAERDDKSRSMSTMVEDKLSEAIKIMLSAKSDGGVVVPGGDSQLACKVKDISDKLNSQALKNKEMELELAQMKSERIKRCMKRESTLGDDHYEFDDEDGDDGADQSTMKRNKKSSYNHNNNNQQEQISILVTKLDKLDKLEELMRKLDNMKNMVPMDGGFGGANGGNGGNSGKRGHVEIKQELEELQKIIMNDRAPLKEKEEANIRFEKVYQELTQTDEHKRELVQMQEEKRRVNEPLNQKALAKLQPIYSASNIERNPDLKDRVRDNPELTLIGMDPKAIMSKHQNDFQHFFLTRINLEELRAIRASLPPKWRSDQRKQIEWTQTLEDKIEQYTKNPSKQPSSAPKSTKPKVTVNLKQPPPPPKQQQGKGSNNGGGNPQANLMNELLKRRKRVEA